MNFIGRTLRKHLRLLRTYPLATVFLLLISITMIGTCDVYTNYQDNHLIHAVGYLLAVWFGAFFTDLLVDFHPIAGIGFPIKRPAGREALLILTCTLLGVLFLVIRFYGNWEHMQGIIKLLLLPLIVFTFPVVLALIYLFRFKYKPRELGINLRYWIIAPVIIFLFGIITFIAAPGSSHWKEAYYTMGLPNMLFTGLISAALPEEFTRMLLQTRLAAALRNKGTGFILASAIWAAIHIPVFGKDYQTEGWYPALLGAVRIMPIGFLWGYITLRSKSIIPATLIHGFNLWGLQNF